MHANLISRLIHATVRVPGGGGGDGIGQKTKYRLIWRPKTISFWQSQVGVGSQTWDTIPRVSVSSPENK